MKPKSINTIMVAALLAPGALFAQTTAKTIPVGYVTTENLVQNQYNLVGVTVHNPTVAAGILTAESASSVTTSGIDFTTLLTIGATYILELPDGTIQEVTTWTATELNTPQDITSRVVPGTTKYRLRKAATVGSLLGAANEIGLQGTPDGDPATADQVFIANGSGFTVVFYDESTPGWVDTLFNDASAVPIVYTDGIVIQRKGPTKSIVFSGEVKTTPTDLITENAYTYLGAVYPVGSTLGNSNLQASMVHTPDGDPATADQIFISNGAGGYDVCFYDDSTPGWVDTLFNDQTNKPLSSGIIIQRRGGTPYTVNLTPANYYSTL